MAWDDPVVWVLMIAVLVFLFGANKIPEQQYFLEKNLFPLARDGVYSNHGETKWRLLDGVESTD
ncbi:MAG: hypothetical protein JRN52_03635 [Nitrososphaerota archaeon]|nr:hypothetical protein [Nitrososphaerota archaeon]